MSSGVDAAISSFNSSATSDAGVFKSLGAGVQGAEAELQKVAAKPNANPGELALAQANLEREKRKLESFAAGKKVMQDIFKSIIDMIKQIR